MGHSARRCASNSHPRLTFFLPCLSLVLSSSSPLSFLGVRFPELS